MTAGKGEQTRGADAGKPAKDYVPKGHGKTDEQIRADVHELLTAQPGSPVQGLSVAVSDGVVTLEGEVQDQRAWEQLVERINSVASVKRVVNRLHAP